MLKWQTPVPQVGLPGTEREFIQRLTQWLREQEQEPEYSLEATLAFGGLGVAEKMFGFEGSSDSYSAPEDITILTGPSGASKKIVTSINVHVVALPGTLDLVHKKGAVETTIADIDLTDHNHVASSYFICLDATDKSLILRILSGSSKVSWLGTYVDVD